jgi:hypothetical protein
LLEIGAMSQKLLNAGMLIPSRGSFSTNFSTYLLKSSFYHMREVSVGKDMSDDKKARAMRSVSEGSTFACAEREKSQASLKACGVQERPALPSQAPSRQALPPARMPP